MQSRGRHSRICTIGATRRDRICVNMKCLKMYFKTLNQKYDVFIIMDKTNLMQISDVMLLLKSWNVHTLIRNGYSLLYRRRTPAYYAQLYMMHGWGRHQAPSPAFFALDLTTSAGWLDIASKRAAIGFGNFIDLLARPVNVRLQMPSLVSCVPLATFWTGIGINIVWMELKRPIVFLAALILSL